MTPSNPYRILPFFFTVVAATNMHQARHAAVAHEAATKTKDKGSQSKGASNPSDRDALRLQTCRQERRDPLPNDRPCTTQRGRSGKCRTPSLRWWVPLAGCMDNSKHAFFVSAFFFFLGFQTPWVPAPQPDSRILCVHIHIYIIFLQPPNNKKKRPKNEKK